MFPPPPRLHTFFIAAAETNRRIMGVGWFGLRTSTRASPSTSPTSSRQPPPPSPPKHHVPPQLSQLRQLVGKPAISERHVEAAFRLYVPLSISANSALLFSDSDFVNLTRFVVDAAAALTLTQNDSLIQHPKPDFNPETLFVKAVKDYKRAVVKEEGQVVMDVAEKLVPVRPTVPILPLPPIIDSFARLLISDIVRARKYRVVSTAADALIPSLVCMRRVSNEAEMRGLLMQLNSLDINDHDLFIGIVASMGISDRSDLALLLVQSLQSHDSQECSTNPLSPSLTLIRVLVARGRFEEALIALLKVVTAPGTEMHLRQSTLNGVLKATLYSKMPLLTHEERISWLSKLVARFWERVSKLDDAHAKDFESGKGVHAAFLDILVKYYTREHDFSSLLTVCRQLSVSNISLSVYANNTMLRYLLNIGQRHLATALFEEMGASRNLNVYTLNTYLHGMHAITNDLTQTLSLFETARKTWPHIQPDVVTYTTLMTACCASHRIDEAERFYREMMSEGVQPNVVSATVLMTAYLRVNDVDKALRLFAEFAGAADTVMHTSVVHSMAQRGDSEGVREGVDRWRKSSHHGRSSNTDATAAAHAHGAACEPDIVLFNILLHFFVRTRQTESCHELLKEISAYGLEPDTFTSTAVVVGLVRVGDVDAAERSLVKMAGRGIPVSLHAVTAIVSALKGKSRKSCVDIVRWVEALVGEKILSGNEAGRRELERIVGDAEAVHKGLEEHGDVMAAFRFVPDYKFLVRAVSALIRSGAPECAEILLRYTLEKKLDGYGFGNLVDRVALLWRSSGNVGRESELMAWKVENRIC